MPRRERVKNVVLGQEWRLPDSQRVVQPNLYECPAVPGGNVLVLLFCIGVGRHLQGAYHRGSGGGTLRVLRDARTGFAGSFVRQILRGSMRMHTASFCMTLRFRMFTVSTRSLHGTTWIIKVVDEHECEG